jgi:hypothetical protein
VYQIKRLGTSTSYLLFIKTNISPYCIIINSLSYETNDESSKESVEKEQQEEDSKEEAPASERTERKEEP